MKNQEKDFRELFDAIEKLSPKTLQESLAILKIKPDDDKQEEGQKEQLLKIFKESLLDSFISTFVEKYKRFWIKKHYKRKRDEEKDEEEKKKEEKKNKLLLDQVKNDIKKEGIVEYFSVGEKYKDMCELLDQDLVSLMTKKNQYLAAIKDIFMVEETEHFLRSCSEQLLDSYLTDLGITESRKSEKWDKILTSIFQLV